MHNAWFPLDPNWIVKSCDSSSVWLIVEILRTLVRYGKGGGGGAFVISDIVNDSSTGTVPLQVLV